MPDARRFVGGCLCGALRYEADGEPRYAGYCYCNDCRKASGSGFIPFMSFARSAVRVSGDTLKYSSRGDSGAEAVRNSCPVCASLVFGGDVTDEMLTIYAGSLDDASLFQPRVAIYTSRVPAWVSVPGRLRAFPLAPPAATAPRKS